MLFQNPKIYFYYIHLVRIIKQCFTREKEDNVESGGTQISRKELNTYKELNKTYIILK